MNDKTPAVISAIVGSIFGFTSGLPGFFTGLISGYIVGYIFLKTMLRINRTLKRYTLLSLFYGTIAGFTSGLVVHIPSIILLRYGYIKLLGYISLASNDAVMIGAFFGMIVGAIIGLYLGMIIKNMPIENNE